jgi:hypothetical protein
MRRNESTVGGRIAQTEVEFATRFLNARGPLKTYGKAAFTLIVPGKTLAEIKAGK